MDVLWAASRTVGKKHPGTGKRKAQHDPTVGKREEKNSRAEPSPQP